MEHKDRLLCRFGTNYMDVLLSRLGIKLEIVNLADNGRSGTDDGMKSHYNVVCSTNDGQRRAKRKTETIIAALETESETRSLSNVTI